MDGIIEIKEKLDNGIVTSDELFSNSVNLAKKYQDKYEYILVDEYQDISIQRFNLCEKLSKCSNAKIVDLKLHDQMFFLVIYES